MNYQEVCYLKMQIYQQRGYGMSASARNLLKITSDFWLVVNRERDF